MVRFCYGHQPEGTELTLDRVCRDGQAPREPEEWQKQWDQEEWQGGDSSIIRTLEEKLPSDPHKEGPRKMGPKGGQEEGGNKGQDVKTGERQKSFEREKRGSLRGKGGKDPEGKKCGGETGGGEGRKKGEDKEKEGGRGRGKKKGGAGKGGEKQDGGKKAEQGKQEEQEERKADAMEGKVDVSENAPSQHVLSEQQQLVLPPSSLAILHMLTDSQQGNATG